MKKFYSLLIALLCSATIAFAYEAEIDGIYYDFDYENTTATVTNDWNIWDDNGAGYTQSEIIIPEKVTYDGVKYSVTSIGGEAFYYCSSLTSITIPNSVTSIGSSAFYGCSSLTSIDVETNNQNYASIDGVLYNKEITALICCPGGKTSITIPNSVTSIEWAAFYGCTSLTSITIPNSVTEIGEYAFYNCQSLTSITIPNSVTEIGEYAFCGCSSLTSITIPNSVTEIGEYAFCGCSSLTSITIPNSVTEIGEYAFCRCSSLTSITIPNSVTEIEDQTFAGCSSLASVTIGNSVTSIGLSAFEGCTSLSSIAIPNSVTSIEGYVFRGCTGLTSIEIPNSVTSIGMSAFEGCTYLSSIAIPNSVTSIERYVFSGCTGLTSVTIGSSVTSIEKNAFENCSSLSSIKWNVKKYNDFDNKYKKNPFVTNPITSFVFGDSVEYIPAYLCYDLNDLNSVIISNSVTEIGERAFYSCDKLRTVEIGNSLETIGSHAFSGCTAIYSISIDAIIPPIVESSTFSSVSRTAQIKVPCNAVAAYQASTYWNEFTNYIESPYSLSIKVNDNSMGIAVIIKQNSCTDVTAQVQAQALPSYEFVKWSDGFTENPHTLFVTENMTITAEFRKIGEEPEDKPGEEEKHNNFIVESADKTQGAVEITITAKAIEGFEFDHWSDGSTENPRVVTLDADVELYAYFRVAGTGLENSVISSANVYGNNGTLYVEGAETDYHVLDAAGRLIYSGRESALSLPRGVYVVNVGGEVQKVVI